MGKPSEIISKQYEDIANRINDTNPQQSKVLRVMADCMKERKDKDTPLEKDIKDCMELMAKESKNKAW